MVSRGKGHSVAETFSPEIVDYCYYITRAVIPFNEFPLGFVENVFMSGSSEFVTITTCDVNWSRK